MKIYRFHWLDGKKEDGQGESMTDAFEKLGYVLFSLCALDYWEVVK